MVASEPLRTDPVRKAPPRTWGEPPRCPACGTHLQQETGGRPAKYCDDACRMVCNRAEGWLRPILRYVARLLEGAETDPGTPLGGLIRGILLSERVRARAELQAKRLPGSPP